MSVSTRTRAGGGGAVRPSATSRSFRSPRSSRSSGSSMATMKICLLLAAAVGILFLSGTAADSATAAELTQQTLEVATQLQAAAQGQEAQRQLREVQRQTAESTTKIFTSAASASAIFESAITVSDILEIDEECYVPLSASDTNSDGRVDRDEYVIFANAISDNYFRSACRPNNSKRCNFDRLPLGMQSNFINLACLCEKFGGSEECCTGDNAHISTDGAGPDEDPTNMEALYLFTVCRDTYTAVEEVITPSPTEKPTGVPSTEEPTGSPTEVPTENPTGSPTLIPTEVPTDAPVTPAPTRKPVVEPTTEDPTPSPTAVPTPSPTPSPTVAPSLNPTSRPTPSPVVEPTPLPTPAPTLPNTPSPTSPPTRSPTKSITGDLPISFEYGISNAVGYSAQDIEDGVGGNTIKDDLVGAMDLLVMEVVEETFGGGDGETTDGGSGGDGETGEIEVDGGGRKLDGRDRRRERRTERRRHLRVVAMVREGMAEMDARRLAVEYTGDVTPTVDAIEDVDCPDTSEPGETCQKVTSTATLYVTDEDPDAITAQFERAMAQAIADGRLDAKLAEYNPANEISSTVAAPPPVPTAVPPPDGEGGEQESRSLGGGAIAGIALGGAAAVGLIAALLVKSRRDGSGPGKDMHQLEDVDVMDDDMGFVEDESRDPYASGSASSSVLGAARPAYGSSNKKQKPPPRTSGKAKASTSKVLGGGGFDDLSVEVPPSPSRPSPAAAATSAFSEGGAAAEGGGGGGGMGAGAAAGIAAGAAGAAALGAAAVAGRRDDDDDSSAGSSGWSSASGKSSLDSDGEELLDRAMGGDGAQIAAAAGSAAGSLPSAGSHEVDAVPDIPEVSRDDLDSAIEAGDWAAVGATAALLASASDSASHVSGTSSRKSGSMASKSSISSLDAARAAELDQLVDQGDWEGVVLAAAKFEAESSSKSTADGGSGSASGSRSAADSRSVGTSSAYTQSTAGFSESPSKVARRAEIRTEVEALVRRVVPDEIDNVDEMMKQFRGREEELVETLRTMQERSVAQRARAAVHKSAKREAKRSVEEKRAAAAAAGVGTAAAVGIGAAAMSKSSTSEKSSSAAEFSDPRFSAVQTASGGPSTAPMAYHDSTTTESTASALYPEGKPQRKRSASRSRSRSPGVKEPRTALEAAIEAGDWEAVGEAAALMSDADSQSYTGSLPSTGTMSSKGRSVGSAGEADRAAELDKLIDSGNWSGVVAAASKYSTMDKEGNKSFSSSSSSKKKYKSSSAEDASESGSGSKGTGSGSWRKKMFGKKSSKAADDSEQLLQQEEQEALAQAKIWESIAAQSKQETGGEARGASEAADWAISRSLNALKKAEESSGDAGGSSGEV